MIKMNEYANRRKKLMKKIGPTGILILPAAEETLRNGDATYSFRQNSDFYYLSGFNETEAVLILLPERAEGEYILFNRPRNRDREIWDGPRCGQEDACKHYLADQSFAIDELATMLPELLIGRDTVHYSLGLNKEFDAILLHALNQVRMKIRTGVKMPANITDIMPSLHEMRLFKSPAEVETMQKAIEISARAHRRAMETCKPGMHEYQLEAELLYEFNKNGARAAAYSSIVGGGKNSCVLHYINNNEVLKSGDLVLIDAGAEYQNYASDITRVFPVNGHFTAEQRTIYELVLESQLAAIRLIKPGVSWDAAQEAIVKVLTQGLVDAGILKGSVNELIEKQAYYPFYMHRSGHWLGLDVHDVGSYRTDNKWRELKPGMVFTVEPGLYFSADIPGLHPRWHHIGVRIEDNVLVTKEGHEVLSHMIPKTVDDIESIMKKSHKAVA